MTCTRLRILPCLCRPCHTFWWGWSSVATTTSPLRRSRFYLIGKKLADSSHFQNLIHITAVAHPYKIMGPVLHIAIRKLEHALTQLASLLTRVYPTARLELVHIARKIRISLRVQLGLHSIYNRLNARLTATLSRGPFHTYPY